MINATLTITVPLNNSSVGGAGGGWNQAGGNSSKGLNGSTGLPGNGMDELVDLLADTLAKSLFKKEGDGATFDSSNPLMKMIADFMDKHGSDFSGPHDATGSVRNWKDELTEDNYLSKSELSDFKQGLKGALSTILGGGLSEVMGTAGSLISGLGALAGGIAGGMLGGPAGGMVGSSIGGALGNSVGGAVSGLGAQLGGQIGGFGSAGFGSAGAGNTGGGGFALRDMSPMAQSGYSMGGSFAGYVGKTAVDGINIKEDDGRYSFSKEDKDLAKAIGKFMDQHTEEFGPQPRGGWASRIERGKDFNSEEIGRFKDAMSAVKSVMGGKSTGDQQLDMDTMLLSNSIINEAMYKVSD